MRDVKASPLNFLQKYFPRCKKLYDDITYSYMTYSKMPISLNEGKITLGFYDIFPCMLSLPFRESLYGSSFCSRPTTPSAESTSSKHGYISAKLPGLASV